MDPYTLRKNGSNGNFHSKLYYRVESLPGDYDFDTLKVKVCKDFTCSDDDELSLAELHIEKMRKLKDMKMCSGRTGISSSRIRAITCRGCPYGQKNCKFCSKKDWKVSGIDTFKFSKRELKEHL